MNVSGDFNYQQGKNISYKKGDTDGWFKLLVVGVAGAVIAGGILYYLGWVG